MKYTPPVGVILAGGESSRMGTPKESVILHDGRPMIEHVAEALSPVCTSIMISGDCPGYSGSMLADVPHLPDRRPGEGPLAALEAILLSGMGERYLAVSCDQALLRAEILVPLAQMAGRYPAFFRAKDRRPHDPFPGIYPATLAAAVSEALDCDVRSIRDFMRTCECRFIPIEAEAEQFLESFNTMQSLRDAGLLRIDK